MSAPLLQIEGLSVRVEDKEILHGIDLQIKKGETHVLMGPNGAGKSTLGYALMGNPKYQITGGKILFEGKDILKMDKNELSDLRGAGISMIFQDSMTSLNPTMRVGKQIAECIRLHNRVSRQEAMQRACELLRLVEIPNPEERLKNYPHQMSGGMRQRVMIAMALSCNPKILIADEPTTALDVTIQAQILDLMKKIQQEEGMSILLITHDLGVVAEMCSRVIVMYAGEIVEEAPVDILFNHPSHPYTIGLIASVPKLGSGVKVLPSIPGSVPDLSMLPKGCRFAPRCKYATERCHNEEPSLFEVSPQQKCRCWLAEPTGKEDK